MHFSLFITIFCSLSLFFYQPCLGKNTDLSLVNKEIQNLYQEVLRAKKENDLSTAKDRLKKILQLTPRSQYKSFFYLDNVLMLSSIEVEQGAYEQAHEHLKHIMSLSPPEEIYFQVQTIKAKAFSKENKPEQAYQMMSALQEKISLENWNEDSRSFYLALELSLNDKHESNLRNAQRLAEGGLFLESIPLYQEVLQAIEQELYPTVSKSHYKDKIIHKIYYRLAKAYYETKKYDKSIQILYKIDNNDNQVMAEKAILLTKSYNGQRNHKTALETAESFLKTGNKKYLEEIYWEMGYSHFFLNHFDKAKAFFSKISLDNEDPQLYYLSKLYLARINLFKKDYGQVEETLNTLLANLPNEEHLRYELHYILGESYYQQQNFQKAITHYQKALPKRNKSLANWGKQTLFNLAWSYLKEAQTSKNLQNKISLFESSERYFKELLTLEPTEETTIALARVYLEKYKLLEDPAAKSTLELLLSEGNSLETINAQAEAISIKAEVQNNYEEKDKLYRTLTLDIYSETPSYAKGWYLRGINDYEEGVRLKASGMANKKHFEQSIKELLKSVKLLEETDSVQAGLGVFYTSRAYANLETKESYSLSLSLLERLITGNSFIFKQLPNQGEILYTKSWIAFQLYEIDNKQDYLHIAQESIKQTLEEFPNNSSIDASLNLLGNIQYKLGEYEQAEDTFVKLANKYPDSPLASQAWFWASECADWQHKAPESIRFYRMQVFEKYPTSPFAPEAYFNFYSFAEYLNGDSQALHHLEKMPEKYPYSPSSSIAYYLLGLNYKKLGESNLNIQQLQRAVISFENAAKLFETNNEINFIPKEQFEYHLTVYFRSLLESGLTHLSLANQQTGIKKQLALETTNEVLLSILTHFEDETSPFSEILKESQPFPKIFEEAHFSLAQLHLTTNNPQKAEEVLTKIIEKYSQEEIQRGYYLSRSWYELGNIAFNKKDISLALTLFKKSEQTSRGKVLSIEQKLKLWIKQSSCYKALNDLDNAMLMLSKVINEDAVSSLRIQAMFLRAEIYELQGRNELAIKQLESVSKQNSDWSLKAKEKLEKTFGFN
jgi:tetratricopeptide (TPR) repeat protein